MTEEQVRALMASRIQAMVEQYIATDEEGVSMDEIIMDASYELRLEFPTDYDAIKEVEKVTLERYFA